MLRVETVLGRNGRVVIPAELRRQLGVETGDRLILDLDEDGVVIRTPAMALRRAQALVRRYVPPGRDLAAELLAERREESGD